MKEEILWNVWLRGERHGSAALLLKSHKSTRNFQEVEEAQVG